jgi:hypothetical protein
MDWGQTVTMKREPSERELDVFELCARDRLEPILGSLKFIDPGGGPESLYDFEAALPGNSIAAIEVTSEVNSQRLELEASAARLLSPLNVPGSEFRWLVGLDADARVKDIDKTKLCRLLSDIEQRGERSVNSRGDYQDPLVCRVRKLRISYVYSFAANGSGQGTVMIGPDFHGGWGWNGPTIDAWLSDFLASPQGGNKLRKLNKADDAAERHLVIMLHPFSQAGLCIPVGLTDLEESGAGVAVLPSFVPPLPVTSLWLIPMVRTWLGLHWERSSGWAVLAGS